MGWKPKIKISTPKISIPKGFNKTVKSALKVDVNKTMGQLTKQPLKPLKNGLTNLNPWAHNAMAAQGASSIVNPEKPPALADAGPGPDPNARFQGLAQEEIKRPRGRAATLLTGGQGLSGSGGLLSGGGTSARRVLLGY